MTKARGGLVRLYPTRDASIPGVPAVERDVPPDEAERLLAFVPPAFTPEPPAAVADQQPDTETEAP